MIAALALLLLLAPDAGMPLGGPCGVDTDCDVGYICLPRPIPGQTTRFVCTPGCHKEHPRCPAKTLCEDWVRGYPRCRDASGHFTSP